MPVALFIVARRPSLQRIGDESAGPLMDVNMMVVLGGRERSRTEFGHLFEAAGLTVRPDLPPRLQAPVKLPAAPPAPAAVPNGSSFPWNP